MEAEIWRNLQVPIHDRTATSLAPNASPLGWIKPPETWVKCNIAASWVPSSCLSGGAWIVRNASGSVVFHSRRSFSNLDSTLLTDLTSLQWSIEAMSSLQMDKVMFETSSEVLKVAFLRRSSSPRINQLVADILQKLNSFTDWRLSHVENERNKVASLIARSVTLDNRFHSYVATGGPSWLQHILAQESAMAPI
ncbi:hypothetical protein Bca52824_093780 [Brassica carinata]|uniref:RNase H type-1 domain-containing protein n=1 Tax=Brassica carinata TaxID=52824 RepID=A0A8X7P1U7_BRACI|nr:hypothetical protein Bca52824_093780 [Brassica carinata]